MDYRPLGTSDLNVSSLCLGTMTWGHQNSEKHAHEQLDYAASKGINFIDNAEMYAVPPKAKTQGLTEEYLGTWLKNNKQHNMIVATKMTGPGLSWIRDGKGLVPSDVASAVDASLKRLQIDTIDLYQLHWPQRQVNSFAKRDFTQAHAENTNNEQMLEMLEALQKQVDAGKIRHIGVSNETPWGLMRYLALHINDANLPRIQSVQNHYSLVMREFDNHTSEVCVKENIGMLAYSCLAGGILTGKYLRGDTKSSSRFNDWGKDRQPGIAQLLHNPIVQDYIDLANKYRIDPTHLALNFVMQRFYMSSVIIGATTMAQLKTCIGAADVTLSGQLLTEIQALHEKTPNAAQLA